MKRMEINGLGLKIGLGIGLVVKVRWMEEDERRMDEEDGDKWRRMEMDEEDGDG